MATRRNRIEVREMKRGRRIRETYLGMTLTNKRSAARAALRSETTEDGESEWTTEDESRGRRTSVSAEEESGLVS
jgi:hypothetical protein